MMTRAHEILTLLTILALTCAETRAEESVNADLPTLTLTDALGIAQRNHPTARSLAAQNDVAAARVAQARAAFIPTLSGSLAYQPQTANPAFTPSFTRALEAAATSGTSTMPSRLPESAQLYNFWSASLGLSWTALDSGKTIFNYRARNRDLDAQRYSSDAQLAQLLYNVKIAFFKVLAAEGAVGVAEETLRIQSQHLEQAKAFFSVGTRTKIDVASTESDVASARLTLTQAMGDLAQARAMLSAALGEETFKRYHLVPPVETDETTADGQRRELLALRETRQSRLESLKASKAAFGPELRLTLGPSWVGTQIDNLTTNFSLAMSVSLPAVWNPFLLHGQLREARANLALADASLAAQKNAITLEVAQARAAFETAKQAVIASDELLRAAKERRDLADGRYRAGVGSVIELSDAELVFFNARFQVLKAHLDRSSARAQLEYATGAGLK